LEAEGLRDKIILIAGGARITNDLAKEYSYPFEPFPLE